MNRHVLSAFEESFLEDGVIAHCACGWKSERELSQVKASEAHAKHMRENPPITCSACGCEIDEVGCGCNPPGA